jgi:hypothetical protein
MSFHNKHLQEREKELEMESDRAKFIYIKKQLLTERIKEPDSLLIDSFFSDILRDK